MLRGTKADLHAHTVYSGYSTLPYLSRLLRESYAGRVSREKGLDLLPDIEVRLCFARLPHRWIVVGDGPYRRTLEQRLPAARFTGTVAHEDMGRQMASADLFVFPSGTDTASNVVLEAQACGLPVIVADRGGPQENMRVDRTGRICRADRSNDFADAIVEIASDAARLQAMAGAARRYAEARRWEDALAPLYRAYRDVAARRRAASTAIQRQMRRAGADARRSSGRRASYRAPPPPVVVSNENGSSPRPAANSCSRIRAPRNIAANP